MIRSSARVTGAMDLAILAPDGRVLSRHRNHNDVVPSGQELLLSALWGETKPQKLVPYLGDESFDPREGPEQDGVMQLGRVEPVETVQEGGKLRLQYRGVAPKDAEIVGGGLVVVFRTRSENRNQQALYNFAKTEQPVELSEGTPLLLTFDLAVG